VNQPKNVIISVRISNAAARLPRTNQSPGLSQNRVPSLPQHSYFVAIAPKKMQKKGLADG
jgi:hypothetical protein